MTSQVTIELLPLNLRLKVERGSPLQDLLFAQGVEFPCGGRGRCKGCRVRLLAGKLPVTEADARLLSREDCEAGWRLACQATATTDLKLELAQWEAAILADDSSFSFTPLEGLGIAVDIGTTTIVAQLLNLATGQVLGVRLALNAQAKHGADVMSRIDFALRSDGQAVLEGLVRRQIGRLVAELLSHAPDSGAELRRIVIVGNTVMHHLFNGISVEPLSHHPFQTSQDGLQTFSAAELGWDGILNAKVHFLPCLGGFVGSDILAGILATKLDQTDGPAMLVDLGTNGEIVLSRRDQLLCASTAAGPAFEGARISMGMRAATGAISGVEVDGGRLKCRILGNAAPRGICGSGLVDAVTAGLELGWILPSGKLPAGRPLEISPPVQLTQADVRELQLAKGAISAGIRLLLEQADLRLEDVATLYLAGAFGNYINRASARRIGLIRFAPDRVRPAGNTALLGAKLALFAKNELALQFTPLRQRIRHVPLNEDPHFQEVFVQEMAFPQAEPVQM